MEQTLLPVALWDWESGRSTQTSNSTHYCVFTCFQVEIMHPGSQGLRPALAGPVTPGDGWVGESEIRRPDSSTATPSRHLIQRRREPHREPGPRKCPLPRASAVGPAQAPSFPFRIDRITRSPHHPLPRYRRALMIASGHVLGRAWRLRRQPRMVPRLGRIADLRHPADRSCYLRLAGSHGAHKDRCRVEPYPAPGIVQLRRVTRRPRSGRKTVKWTGMYLVGFFILLGGVLAALWKLGILASIGTTWTVIGVVIAVGIGIMVAVSHSGAKENIEIQRK